jgi:transposase, IS30 family
MSVHLDIGKRSRMEVLFNEGYSTRVIGKRLGCSASTVSRERQRNLVEGIYKAEQADAMADARKQRPGARTFTPAMQTEIVEGLSCGFTPEGISGRAKYEGRAMVSHETIYKFIYTDARAGGKLWRDLPRSRRKRRRRCPRSDRASRIPNRQPIEDRPAVANGRRRLGDWEADTVVGSDNSGRLVTLVDRRSRYSLVRRVDNGTKEQVTAALTEMLAPLPAEQRLTVTYDNGLEFSGHEAVTAATGAAGFFAAPYHSWERGTNENTNGLIRRFLPKGESFAWLQAEFVGQIEYWLNHRPRKVLGWLTPHEVMVEGEPIPRKFKNRKQELRNDVIKVVQPAAPPPSPLRGVPFGERAAEPQVEAVPGCSLASAPSPTRWTKLKDFIKCCID